MSKKLNLPNDSQLLEMYRKNKELKEIIRDFYMKDAMEVLSNWIDCFDEGVLDYYEIGFSQNNDCNYIEIEDTHHYYPFLVGLKKLIEKYRVLDKEYLKEINDTQEKILYLSLEEGFEGLKFIDIAKEEEVKEKINYFISLLIKIINKKTFFNDKILEDYFLEYIKKREMSIIEYFGKVSTKIDALSDEEFLNLLRKSVIDNCPYKSV